MSQNITPQSVSRVLHRGGLTTVPMNGPREGVSVSKSYRPDQVHVQVSIVGSSRHETVLITEARRILQDSGYTVELANDTHLYVTKAGA